MVSFAEPDECPRPPRVWALRVGVDRSDRVTDSTIMKPVPKIPELESARCRIFRESDML
jgi:hypothetical protein